ncbi:MAG: metallophosphoesterase, partial [Planctomycetota bacterium]|nr:metallophosphoesterase [Planctomycetota bacterium]
MNSQFLEREELSQGRVTGTLAAAPSVGLEGVDAGLEAVSTIDAAKRCASLALQIAKAKVFGTEDQVKILQNEFDFNVCDPFWGTCIKEYVAHFQLQKGTIPYRAGLNNILPTPVSAKAKIALFGDWGTGTSDAITLLQQIKGFKPDILMHLGDIYYSGTKDEVQERFLNVIKSVYSSGSPPCFSLAGNHDMYSGGEGYYFLVDQLGQKASYFAIQNADWLFIGMDTG